VVLDEQGMPVSGLYACGNDMASIMDGTYPGPGITIGPAMVFGYRIALHVNKAIAQCSLKNQVCNKERP
ncbi:MAG: FAD-binding protein, partial [Advenella sp.]